MIKIWLDDERDPTSSFIQERFGAKGDEVWYKTADEAITALASGTVESISFDHDLGDGPSGQTVANYIEACAFYGQMPRLSWRVHSANPVGVRSITAAMYKAEEYWDKNEEIKKLENS